MPWNKTTRKALAATYGDDTKVNVSYKDNGNDVIDMAWG